MVDFASVPLPGGNPLEQSKDTVSILIDNRVYSSWRSIRILKSMNQIAHSFDIQSFDKWRKTRETWPMQSDSDARIYIGSNLVMTGFIDVLNPSVTKDDRAINMVGRSLAGDLVDSSAVFDPGTFRDISLKDLAQKFADQFGIEVVDKVGSGVTFPEVTIRQGESIFELLDRCAKQQGVLFVSNVEGNLEIVNLGQDSPPGLTGATDLLSAAKSVVSSAVGSSGPGVGGAVLQQGTNIKTATANFDSSQLYKKYIVKGQRRSKDSLNFEDPLRVEASVEDISVKRNRTLVILAEQSVDPETALIRAKWERSIRRARAASVIISVKDWFRPDDALWDVNTIVDVDCRFVGLSPQPMLISDVELTKDDGGTNANITVIPPESYSLKEPGQRPELGWKQDIFGAPGGIDLLNGILA